MVVEDGVEVVMFGEGKEAEVERIVGGGVGGEGIDREEEGEREGERGELEEV